MKFRKGKTKRWEIFGVQKGGGVEVWDSFETKAEAMSAWKNTYRSTSDGGKFVLVRVDLTLIKKPGQP
jgi:hypothetical protein